MKKILLVSLTSLLTLPIFGFTYATSNYQEYCSDRYRCPQPVDSYVDALNYQTKVLQDQWRADRGIRPGFER